MSANSMELAVPRRCSVEIEHKFYIEMPFNRISNSYGKDRLLVMKPPSFGLTVAGQSSCSTLSGLPSAL